MHSPTFNTDTESETCVNTYTSTDINSDTDTSGPQVLAVTLTSPEV